MQIHDVRQNYAVSPYFPSTTGPQEKQLISSLWTGLILRGTADYQTKLMQRRYSIDILYLGTANFTNCLMCRYAYNVKNLESITLLHSCSKISMISHVCFDVYTYMYIRVGT